MKEYTYVLCKNDQGQQYKRYVEVLCEFDYMGRTLFIHRPVGAPHNTVCYTISDKETGCCLAPNNCSVKTPSKRSAVRVLNEYFRDNEIHEWDMKRVRKLKKDLARAPKYHKVKKTPEPKKVKPKPAQCIDLDYGDIPF